MPNALESTDEKKLWNLIDRAQKGDATALPGLKEFFAIPECVDLLGGHLGDQALETLARTAAGKNLAMQEALRCKCKAMRAELAGPNPSAIERLLADRAVACWLFLSYCECMMAQSLASSLNVQDFHQRRVDHAHKRYLSALRTLAQVRKLALPVLQVNIARKQVNVAAPLAMDAAVGEDKD